MADLCDRLRILRKERNLKQQDMADRFGQSLRAYQYYESGTFYPEIPNLIKLADYFGVTTDYLLGRSDQRG